MSKRILVHAGGGAKGRLSAEVLSSLEKKYGPLYKYYDLLAGSSVGAINSALIATGKLTAISLKDMYNDLISKVFRRGFGIPFYDRKNFISIWDDVIGHNFLMGDCRTRLQITSINNRTKLPNFFKSWENEDGNELLLDVVLRSFAAPLYFGQIVDQIHQAVWFDGGMGFDNIPIDEARIEAMYFLGWSLENLLFDVVGCGYVDNTLSMKEASSFQVVRQLLSFFDLPDGGLARSQSGAEQVARMTAIANISTNMRMRYWDVIIDNKYDKLDGIQFIKQYTDYGVAASKAPLIDAGNRSIE